MQARYLSSTRTLLPLLNTPLARRQFHSHSTSRSVHLVPLSAPSTASPQATSMYFRPPRPDIYANFHRTTLPIAPWSTDWETCDTILFFTPSLGWYNLSDFDFYVKRVMQIEGPLRPIAFIPNVHEADILFEAGGEYYEIDDCYFVRYGGGFTGPDDFLRQLPHLKRLVEEFPDSEDDLYFEACREQRRLVEASGQKLYN